MTCSFMGLTTLQFEMRLQKCIRMGITIFNIFIWGHISSSDIHSEITFYGSAQALLLKLNFRPYIQRYTSPNKNVENSYPQSIISISNPVNLVRANSMQQLDCFKKKCMGTFNYQDKMCMSPACNGWMIFWGE